MAQDNLKRVGMRFRRMYRDVRVKDNITKITASTFLTTDGEIWTAQEVTDFAVSAENKLIQVAANQIQGPGRIDRLARMFGELVVRVGTFQSVTWGTTTAVVAKPADFGFLLSGYVRPNGQSGDKHGYICRTDDPFAVLDSVHAQVNKEWQRSFYSIYVEGSDIVFVGPGFNKLAVELYYTYLKKSVAIDAASPGTSDLVLDSMWEEDIVALMIKAANDNKRGGS